MITNILSRILIIIFGTLHPAYSTYKAMKKRDYREQLKLQMYWIHFACFTVAEPLMDIFLFWLPFYSEMKLVYTLWSIPLSPISQGGIFAYKYIELAKLKILRQKTKKNLE